MDEYWVDVTIGRFRRESDEDSNRIWLTLTSTDYLKTRIGERVYLSESREETERLVKRLGKKNLVWRVFLTKESNVIHSIEKRGSLYCILF